jgi:PPOX class probable F420-dependent enzyme
VPTTPLPQRVTAMLSAPNPCVIACLGPGGHPVSVATWYLLDGGRVLVNMDEGRRRLDYLRRDRRVSLTVFDGGRWHTHVSIQGRVAEFVDDRDLADIDRLCKHYTGKPFQNRGRGRVSAWIAVRRWNLWGAARPRRLTDV